jgi:nitroreductase
MALNLLKQRSSIRQYEIRPVEREKLEIIIDVARLAPTAFNEQPWEFIVVTEEALRQKLAGLIDNGCLKANVPAYVVVFCRDTKYYLEDGSAATTYILLAATGLGLGSCWIAGDKMSYADEVRKILSFPEGYHLISIVSLGYPAKYYSKANKRPQTEVLHWEKF